ncbi:AMP-binding enzyme [Microbacterium sp. UBA837]|uniref:AMP-binding enzyme n=1 Tax=Microbacterium sp. UBA837 TaxID=1946956 RepID=UPI0025F647D5|nr:hypothetical protein [Microbacterium sp. UBA837]
MYSAEVESALAGHPAVGDIAIVGRPDDEYGEKVVAVTPRDGAELTLADLRDDELPRNPSGKILKHRIRKKLHG